MAQFQQVIRCELDPSKPVQEICAVIMQISAYHPGQEEVILHGVRDAIEQRITQLVKGGDGDGESVREPRPGQ